MEFENLAMCPECGQLVDPYALQVCVECGREICPDCRTVNDAGEIVCDECAAIARRAEQEKRFDRRRG